MDFQWLFNQTFFTNLSIWMTLMPIGFSLRVVRSSKTSLVMLCLLTIGLLTELSAKLAGPGTFSTFAFLGYCFLECTLFHVIIRKRLSGTGLQAVTKSTLQFSLPIFMVCYFFSPSLLRIIAVFCMSYQVLISFLAGREILKLIEADATPIKDPDFWLLLGIFFYCFTTFFLMGIIDLTAVRRLWDPYHNTINIVTYLTFSLAFWLKHRMTNLQKT